MVLVDTTEHLTEVEVVSRSPGLVRAEAGATMEAVITELSVAMGSA